MSNLGPLTKTFTPPTSHAPTNAFSQIDGGYLFYLVQGAVAEWIATYYNFFGLLSRIASPPILKNCCI